MAGIYRKLPPRRAPRPFVYTVAAAPAAASLVLQRALYWRRAPRLQANLFQMAPFMGFASAPVVVVTAVPEPVRLGRQPGFLKVPKLIDRGLG